MATHEEAEIDRLRQGLWDVYRILGFDTDGDPTPSGLVTDIVKVVTEAATEARKDYDDACYEIATLEARLEDAVSGWPGDDLLD